MPLFLLTKWEKKRTDNLRWNEKLPDCDEYRLLIDDNDDNNNNNDNNRRVSLYNKNHWQQQKLN